MAKQTMAKQTTATVRPGGAKPEAGPVLQVPAVPWPDHLAINRRRIEMNLNVALNKKLMALFGYLQKTGGRIAHRRPGALVPTREVIEPAQVLIWLLEQVELTGTARKPVEPEPKKSATEIPGPAAAVR